jgi:thiol:disulfide interchange protein
VVGLLLIFSLGICTAQNKEGVRFLEISFEQALEQARQEGKQVFVNYSTKGCAPCKMMDMSVYTNTGIAEKMNEKLICIKLDPIKDKSIEKRAREEHQIKGFPTMLFFKANGELISKAVGGKSIEEFNLILDEVLKNN